MQYVHEKSRRAALAAMCAMGRLAHTAEDESDSLQSHLQDREGDIPP
jgi:hypothetical protein